MAASYVLKRFALNASPGDGPAFNDAATQERINAGAPVPPPGYRYRLVEASAIVLDGQPCLVVMWELE